MTTSPTTRDSRRGFTLIELCVVLVLVAILLTIALPRYGGFFIRGTLRSEARRIAALARYLSNESRRSGLVHYINFDVGHDEYWVTVDAGRAKATGSTAPLAEARVLPEGIRFRDVTVLGVGRKSLGVQRIAFRPRGENDEAIVHLSNYAKNRLYSLHLKPYHGKTEIFDYYYTGQRTRNAFE